MEIQTMTSAADANHCLHCPTTFVDSWQISRHLFSFISISFTNKMFFFSFLIDGSQHHHVCSRDGRLFFPVQQLEVLVERILHQTDEFHMTFINGVIFSPSIYFEFILTHFNTRK